MKKTREPVQANIKGEMTIEPKGAYYCYVRPSGNSAAIPFLKKFIGKKVLVLEVSKIKKKPKEESLEDLTQLDRDLAGKSQ